MSSSDCFKNTAERMSVFLKSSHPYKLIGYAVVSNEKILSCLPKWKIFGVAF